MFLRLYLGSFQGDNKFTVVQGGSSYWNCVSSNSESEHVDFDIVTGPLQCIFVTAGEYLELTEDQTSERHQELLAEFERRKKVNIWKRELSYWLKSITWLVWFATCRAGILWWISLLEFWIMNVGYGPFSWLRNDAFIYNIKY